MDGTRPYNEASWEDRKPYWLKLVESGVTTILPEGALVALCWCNEVNLAVTVLGVVPAHKVLNPPPGFQIHRRRHHSERGGAEDPHRADTRAGVEYRMTKRAGRSGDKPSGGRILFLGSSRISVKK